MYAVRKQKRETITQQTVDNTTYDCVFVGRTCVAYQYTKFWLRTFGCQPFVVNSVYKCDDHLATISSKAAFLLPMIQTLVTQNYGTDFVHDNSVSQAFVLLSGP